MNQTEITYQKDLYLLLCRIKNTSPKKISVDEMESFTAENLHLIKHLIECKEDCDNRLREMANVIISYSNKDFTKKAFISDNNNEFDGLSAGINMLGEELSSANISLHEKEVLLKEIHHRVKNNLQLVSSLINLQSCNVDDLDTKKKFKDCQARIKSMALVHEKLYRSKNFSQINFSNYLNELITEIEHSYSNNASIKVNQFIQENLFLNLDIAISVGLIINELLINAFKHAFINSVENPTLQIQLKENEETIFVKIKDNGCGLSDNFNLENSSSLGLTVVTSLIEQIDGKIEFTSISGTTIDFSFKK